MERDMTYSYSSKPRPVQTNRAKDRDNGNKPKPINIMHDRRIPRGSVFAPVKTSRSVVSLEKLTKRRSIATSKVNSSNNKKTNSTVVETPSRGFSAISLQEYLIEHSPPNCESDSFSQTDQFVLNANKNLTSDAFMRPKIGIDTSTHIDESDGLFDFDVEVIPLLNVLVDKTLAQALLEVEEQLEVERLYCHHEELKGEKNDEKQLEHELEERTREEYSKKELIKEKKAAQQHRDHVMREKLSAWQFARPLVSHAIDQATVALQKKGVFYDPRLRNIAIWLDGDVNKEIKKTICLQTLSTELLDDLIVDVLRR